MWDSIIVGVIVCLCIFLVGRKMFRQFKAATDPNVSLDCGCGCSDKCAPGCSPGRKEKKG